MWTFIKRVFWLCVILAGFSLAIEQMGEANGQEDETRTRWFFREATESVGGAGKWLLDRGKDAADGIGEATQPGASENHEASRVIREEAQEVRHYKLAFLAHFIELAGAPPYCFDHASQDMPDSCYEPVSGAVEEAYRELLALRKEIDEEMRARKMVPPR